jgi:hypothetical protein
MIIIKIIQFFANKLIDFINNFTSITSCLSAKIIRFGDNYMQKIFKNSLALSMLLNQKFHGFSFVYQVISLINQ